MRFLVIDRGPRFLVPPEQLPALLQAFADWRERYRSTTEVFEFFADGSGGFGIYNAPDEATLLQGLLDFPFRPFDDIEVRPILDGDKGLAQFQAFIQARMAAMSKS